MNAAYDELQGVSVSRLRALGDVTEAMNVATVKLVAGRSTCAGAK